MRLSLFFMFKGGPGDYNRVMIWTSGSLWGAGWAYVRALVPVILLGGAYIFIKAECWTRKFSDERRLAGEFPIERERKKCCSVQLFLREHRLHLPEISALSDCLRRCRQKKVVGNGHRVSLLLATLIAAVMLIFADTVARNLFSPIEIPGGNCGVAGWCTVFCIPDVEGVAKIWKQ